MQVPYDEGVANRIGPESCAVAAKAFGEALTAGSVPLGLLIRCKPRSLPGVRPLLMRTTALQWVELSMVGIERDLLYSKTKGIDA